MKYILIFLLALLCSVGYAQNPVSQYLGSPTTTVISRGALKADSSLILPQFPDTTTANRSPYIKFYPGNLIRVFNDIYMRNTTATKWELINGGGTGGNNFIDSLRKVGDSVYARKYGVFVYQYTDSAQNILANNGLSFSGDTLQLGGSLTKNTQIDQSNKIIDFNQAGEFNIKDTLQWDRLIINPIRSRLQKGRDNADFTNPYGYVEIVQNEAGVNTIMRTSTFNNDSAYNNSSIAILNSRLTRSTAAIGTNTNEQTATTNWGSEYNKRPFIQNKINSIEGSSEIYMSIDSVLIKTGNGGYYIDNIAQTSDTLNSKPLVYNPTTRKVNFAPSYNSIDTTSLSNRINGKIDSLYKSGDSVYARKNGVFVFQYIDSSINRIKANNGLTKVGDTLQLGGSLTKNTNIIGKGYGLNVDSTDYIKLRANKGIIFSPLNQTVRPWTAIEATANGDIYATSGFGDIYKSVAGGTFTALGQDTREWRGIAVAPNGDVYATVNLGDIYKQTGGIGNFAPLGQTSRVWTGIAVAPNGDIYACVEEGRIYKSIDGGATFSVLSVSQRRWFGIAVAPNGDVYATVNGGNIWKSTNGGVTFNNISDSGNWLGIAVAQNGDIYVTVYNGDIYKSTNSGATFVALGQTSRDWYDITVAPNNDVYATVKWGDIYKYTPKESNIDIYTDSIVINPYGADSSLGNLQISKLKYNSDTTGYFPLMWNKNIKKLEAYTGGFPSIDTNSLRRVKYVGLTMPSAFNVTGSPITDSGTIAVTGAGTASQYVRGDGVLASFPTATTGGGASVSYYLNGSVNKGTFGGQTYYEMSRTAIIGAGSDFTRTNAQGDGVVAQFITDTITNLLIPAGNWNLELYFNASSGGGTPSFYVELYKYDGTNFTLISSNSTSPELIAFGTTINPYFCALAVPETILSGTDRLAIRVFVNTSGRSITLHTENSHLCQVITTFTTGLTAINGLTKQVQYFATGTSGTDFNISSSNDTHNFNLPTASATNRGALSSTDWSTFNNKLNPSDTISLSNRINTKLNISDTANTWVTSVFRKTASDSVFFVRGGTNNFAFKDSLGGGLTVNSSIINGSSTGAILYTGGSNILRTNTNLASVDTINSAFFTSRIRLNSSSNTIPYFADIVNNASPTTFSITRNSGYATEIRAWDGTSATVPIITLWGRGVRIGNNTANNNNSAYLDVESTTRGFLQPRMTTTQMNAISTPATGLSVFNTTDSLEYVYRGTSSGWQKNVTYTRTNDIGLLNGADQRLMIEPTTNIVAGRALTVEAGSTQAGGNSNFNTLSQGTRNWVGMGAASNGDIYVAVNNGNIFRRTGGTGNFTALTGSGSRAFIDVAVAPNGDIYATEFGGDVWKSTNNGTTWTGLGLTARQYSGVCVAPNGDIYVAVYSTGVTGDIFISTNNGTSFTSLSQTSRRYIGMGAAPNGDIYVVTDATGVFKRTGGTGNFIATGASSLQYHDVSINANNEVFIVEYTSGNIYKSINGGTTFTSMNQTLRNWRGIVTAPNGDIYASVSGGDIYLQSQGTADLNGGTLVLQSGVGKGTGTSTINFNTGTTLASGATLQSASTKMTILGNGNVGIGTTSPSAKLELSDTARGFLQTRMTTTQMNAIVSPSVGLQVFNTTDSSNYVYRGTGGGWQPLATGNIYTTNGTLTGNRTVTLNGNSLAFAGTSAANTTTIGSNGSIGIGNNFNFNNYKLYSAGNIYCRSATNASSSIALLVENASTGQLITAYGDGSVYLGTDTRRHPNSNFSIGTATDIASAQLQVTSTTKGFLPPRMTTTQRDAINTPAEGLVIYNTTTKKHQGYDGTTWNDFY